MSVANGHEAREQLPSKPLNRAGMFEVPHGGVHSWRASKRGKSYLTPAAPTLHCPVGREQPEQSDCERQNSSATSLQNSADQLMVLTGLLKIANRLQLFTPHRILGVSRDISYGNHYRPNHWALSSLHKWTELDWVSRGSPFNTSKECGPPCFKPSKHAKTVTFEVCVIKVCSLPPKQFFHQVPQHR